MDNFVALQAETASGPSRRSDRERLLWLGERLDSISLELNGDTLAMWLSRVLLQGSRSEGKYCSTRSECSTTSV